jgi:hypothetical protein
MSSMGPPLSMIIATLTPADGEPGADSTSFPLSASSMSSTSNAT